ncbi:MAG: hypothetical protein IKZ19_05295, partial [Clostridia bacterium]|nr:hypothetical protein [Clostridia bacterium]
TDFSNVREELDRYFRDTDIKTEELVAALDKVYEAHRDEDVYSIRAELTKYLCENCDIQVFGEFPFFSQFTAGRHRHSWGGLSSPVGRYLLDKNANKWLDAYCRDTEPDRDGGFLQNWNNPVGVDHFCLGYDTILSKGFSGIISDISAKLEAEGLDPEQRNFLKSAAASCESLLCLADRFAAMAKSLGEKETDPAKRRNYFDIASAAENVPKNPARSFYEGICSVFFCRECISTLEGFGVSTFGHLDRMLYPYLEKDIASGRIDMEEASRLIHMLLIYTDVRFESETSYNETSTTIILGGCDSEGKTVFNDVTRLVLKAVLEGRYISTKINCRISSAHPAEYIGLLTDIQTANIAVIVMQNDEVLIPAMVKRGIAVEDARCYVSGGCHEIVPANTSVCTRADTWISLPRLVLKALENSESSTFEEFYGEFLETVRGYILRIEELKNKYEAFWHIYAPMPLCSATLTGCISSGRDLTAGGAKYSNTALSLLGVATFVDSLCAIKTVVFEEKKLTLAEFRAVLNNNFKGDLRLRSYILRRIPKYGTGNIDADSFAAKALEDISGMFGQKNGRGGVYLPAIYPHDIFRPLGVRCPATPDGRLSGEYLSRGCSPSETTEVGSPLDIIASLKAIDFTNYAESVCAEITLPQLSGERGKTALAALIAGFLENGGSSMQFNLVDRELLIDAKNHPEHHGDIIVRVCGYSAVFVALDCERQDEMIARSIRQG